MFEVMEPVNICQFYLWNDLNNKWINIVAGYLVNVSI